jgi:hypothetical protein
VFGVCFVALLAVRVAVAAAPAIGSVRATHTMLTVTFVGFTQSGAYGVEVSRSPSTRGGHFAKPIGSLRGLRLPPDLIDTVQVRRRFAPGNYYVRVWHDYTTSYRALWRRLCRRFECRPPRRGRVLEWSRTVEIAIR